jgi:hypothetical protein
MTYLINYRDLLTNGCIAHCWGLTDLFSVLILYTVGRDPWTGDQPQARPLPKHTTTGNKRTQTSMTGVRFEPRMSVFERVKTVHASDSSTTVMSIQGLCLRPYGALQGIRSKHLALNQDARELTGSPVAGTMQNYTSGTRRRGTG